LPRTSPKLVKEYDATALASEKLLDEILNRY
jgi:hypothetical protein